MKQMFIYMYMLLMLLILVMISVMLSVAFLTLMERKFLSYIQLRKGPNKVGFKGIMQPFSDAIKLLTKEMNYMNKINYLFFIISPMYMIILGLMMWLLYPFLMNYYQFGLTLLYLMCCFSLSVYGLMLSGWSSNSSYSMLGSIRSLAQSISYEVILSLIMIIPMMMINSLNLMKLFMFQNKLGFIYFMWPLALMLFFCMMAELNRTPFDFSEGESELVSGFNVEYSGSGFILIFLSEYAGILFMSFVFLMFFSSGGSMILFYFKIMFMSFFIIWLRGTLPRFRYDLLMYFCWLLILPMLLNYMSYMIFLKIFI